MTNRPTRAAQIPVPFCLPCTEIKAGEKIKVVNIETDEIYFEGPYRHNFGSVQVGADDMESGKVKLFVEGKEFGKADDSEDK
jgi:hypothetical protein